MFNASFSNKTQLKIIFLFYWVGPGSIHSFEPDRNDSTVQGIKPMNSGTWLHYSWK